MFLYLLLHFFISVGSNNIDLNFFSLQSGRNVGCLLSVHSFSPSSKVLSPDFVWISYPSLHSLEDDPVPTSRGDQVVDLGIEGYTRPASEK